MNLITGNQAPGFELPSLHGDSVSLASLLKKGPVVAAFFKVSCPVCQFTFPFLQRIYERHRDTPATIVGISQDDIQATAAFNRDYRVTFPTLVDAHPYAVSNAYGLTNVPTIFLIQADRTVEVASMGFGKADLEHISRTLAEQSKLPAAPLFRNDEVIPAYKPG